LIQVFEFEVFENNFVLNGKLKHLFIPAAA